MGCCTGYVRDCVPCPCFITSFYFRKPTLKTVYSPGKTLFRKTNSLHYLERNFVVVPKLFLFACAKGKDNVEKFREKLERSLGEENQSYTKSLDGFQLRNLLLERYGFSYDIRLKVTPWFSGKYLLTANIMWLYAEQQSFPLTEHEYLCHLEAIAQYLNQWGVVPQFVNFVKTTKQKPRVAKSVSVPLDVSQEEIVKFMNCNK